MTSLQHPHPNKINFNPVRGSTVPQKAYSSASGIKNKKLYERAKPVVQLFLIFYRYAEIT